AEKIGRLLERLAKGNGGVALRALVGLRWFDSTAGWQLIRQRATDGQNWLARRAAIEQLGYKDEPANRDLLMKALRVELGNDIVETAFTAMRRLFGRDSLQPHFALIQSPVAAYWVVQTEQLGVDVLKAVTERGDVRDIFDIFPRCVPKIQD